MCPPPGSSDGSDGSRFGARASLWVHQLESDSEPLPAVTASSPGPARVLDVDRNSLIYIGGLGAHGQVSPAEGHACAGVRPRVISVCVGRQRPAALRSSTFQGCLGEASLNERNVGLWNYDSREGECGGCFSRYRSKVTGLRPARTESPVRLCQSADGGDLLPLRRLWILAGPEVSPGNLHLRRPAVQNAVTRRTAAVPGLQQHGTNTHTRLTWDQLPQWVESSASQDTSFQTSTCLDQSVLV